MNRKKTESRRNQGNYTTHRALVLVAVAAGISLIFVIFLNSFFYILNDREFYADQIALNKVHVDGNEYNATMMLIDYLNNGISIDAFGDFFNEKEKTHLEDVRVLVHKVRILAYASLAVLVLTILYLAYLRRDFLKGVSFAFRIGGFAALGTLVLAAILLSNFDWAFVKFHEVLFTNDLWILDPAKDHLIQLFPGDFFRSFALRIGVLSCVSSCILITAGYLMPKIKA